MASAASLKHDTQIAGLVELPLELFYNVCEHFDRAASVAAVVRASKAAHKRFNPFLYHHYGNQPPNKTLLWGIQKRIIRTVEHAIESGAEVNASDLGDKTPLDRAIATHNEAMVATLLDAGAVIDRINVNGLTPFLYACQVSIPRVASLLLERGANARHKSADGESALGSAVKGVNLGTVKFLLDLGQDPNNAPIVDWQHIVRPVLSRAAMSGSLDCVNLLLRRGASAKMATGECHGGGPIISALRAKRTKYYAEVIKVLLAAGADPDERDETGNTALCVAAKLEEHYKLPMVSLLLEHGADPNFKTDSTGTPVSFCINAGLFEVLPVLRRHGGCLASCNLQGRTAASYAAEAGKREILDQCVALNLDFESEDSRDNSGKTPMDWAAQNGHEGLLWVVLGRFRPKRAARGSTHSSY